MLTDTLIVIPARLNSTRLPRKPLADINGFPMIYWVAKKVQAANICDYVVATDSLQIKEVCESYGLEVVMTSSKCRNGTERISEVATSSDYKYFVNVQGDEPLIDMEGVRAFVSQACEYSGMFVQAVTTTFGSKNDISEVKVALDKTGRVRYLSRHPVPFHRESDRPTLFKCIGLYFYERDVLDRFVNLPEGHLERLESVEQLRCIENDLPIMAVDVGFDSISVDTPQDLELVRSLASTSSF